MATDVSSSADNRIQCLVVTPERTVLDERVDFVVLPLYDGELGVLPGHSPLIGRLGYGELRTRLGGAVSRFFLDGGFVQLRDDVVTILTGRAIPASQLDSAAASKDLEQAQARVARTDAEQAEKAKALARAGPSFTSSNASRNLEVTGAVVTAFPIG